MASLAPEYNEDRHGAYYNHLVDAIGDRRHHNIALTGAYGAGKSSILQHLVEERRSKVIVLSLSTITPDAHGRPDDDEIPTPVRTVRTQGIQKEIVKQLLYRLKPSKVPQSRFRRPDLPNHVGMVLFAACIAAALVALALVVGFDLIQPHVSAVFPEFWRQLVVYSMVSLLVFLLAWVGVRLMRMRPKVSASVQSGIATVTLSNNERDYFDAYLDEIVYFFQASRAEIVIIEDIDRFEDVQVFDTLRALNNLLNGSKQVGRRVVFIYAIRDSVFEQLGVDGREFDPTNAGTGNGETLPDHAREALKRASRTKFFDVIIPVVPFVSATNARDLMSDVMKSDSFTISPALIRLAARHVADMRLIHNIRNEFEVYRDRLILTPNRVPGITEDIVFAIVLYKNTHLADFEKIRHRDSRLDDLFLFGRKLVRDELRNHTDSVAALRKAHRLEATVAARAARLGTKMLKLRDTLRLSAEDAQATVELSGPATDANVSEPETWNLLASGEEQQIIVSGGSGRYETDIKLSFTANQLAGLLGVNLDADDWESVDTQGQESEVTRELECLDFLRHSDWEALAERKDFSSNFEGLKIQLPAGTVASEPVTFNSAVELLLVSELARDLVRNGYLTSHFAVYSASYYGTHLGPEAREYIWRCVEPGVPDSIFFISPDQVEQLLREQDADKNDRADLFEDASIYNVSILDYLLEHRPGAAETVARRLAAMGDAERDFIDLYVSHGAAPALLIVALTPHWPAVLTFIAGTEVGASSSRLALFDAALSALPHARYEVDDEVKALFEGEYMHLQSVGQPVSMDSATTVFTVLGASHSIVDRLEPLNDHARRAAVALDLYPLTLENYRVLVPAGPIGLDILSSIPSAYQHTLNNLQTFLDLIESSGNEVVVAAEPASFGQTINDTWEHASIEELTRLITVADSCRIDLLTQVTAAAWPALVTEGRTDASYANVAAYIGAYGVDRHLGEMIRKAKEVSAWRGIDRSERRTVALAILNAPGAIASSYTRVQIAKKLTPGNLAADDLVPESGDLVSRLISAKLLADDEHAFSKRLMVDWPTLRTTVLKSKAFSSFASPEILTVDDFNEMVRDDGFTAILPSLFTQLADILEGTSRAMAIRLTTSIVQARWHLGRGYLETLLRAGARPHQIIQLIHLTGDKLSTDDILAVLRLLGGKYAQVTQGGKKRPNFTYDESHKYVFTRLIDITVRQIKETTTSRWGHGLTVYLK